MEDERDRIDDYVEELESLLREACQVAGIEFHEAKFAPADLADRIVALEAELAWRR